MFYSVMAPCFCVEGIDRNRKPCGWVDAGYCLAIFIVDVSLALLLVVSSMHGGDLGRTDTPLHVVLCCVGCFYFVAIARCWAGGAQAKRIRELGVCFYFKVFGFEAHFSFFQSFL